MGRLNLHTYFRQKEQQGWCGFSSKKRNGSSKRRTGSVDTVSCGAKLRKAVHGADDRRGSCAELPARL